MEEPGLERPAARKRPEFVKAFTKRLRHPGDRGGFIGRLITAGLSVVMACTLAIGIGAIIHRKKGPVKTANAADRTSNSLTVSRGPTAPGGVPRRLPMNSPAAAPSNPGREAMRIHKSDKTAPADSNAGPTSTSAASSGGGGGDVKAMRQADTVPVRSIVSFASSRCIDVTDGRQSAGTPLQIWDCSGASWQKWAFEPDGTLRSLGMCMAVADGSHSDGAPIQIESCNGGPAQRFNLNQSWDLVNIAADKCVDVKDKQTANGVRLQLWQCAGTSNQKWRQG